MFFGRKHRFRSCRYATIVILWSLQYLYESCENKSNILDNSEKIIFLNILQILDFSPGSGFFASSRTGWGKGRTLYCINIRAMTKICDVWVGEEHRLIVWFFSLFLLYFVSYLKLAPVSFKDHCKSLHSNMRRVVCGKQGKSFILCPEHKVQPGVK